MRKLALLLAILIVISISTEVSATTWAYHVSPELSFSGSTAICKTTVRGGNTSDYIEVTMTLKLGENYITSWTESAYGYICMKETTPVGVGSTYTLIVDVTMNGVAYEPISIEKACWP